jgi:CspA family cold shock protein
MHVGAEKRRMVSMARGTVKWFSDAKGYGFITPDRNGPDVFVHYTGVADDGFRTLAEGDRVEYEVREGRKGPEAFAVRRTGELPYLATEPPPRGTRDSALRR